MFTGIKRLLGMKIKVSEMNDKELKVERQKKVVEIDGFAQRLSMEDATEGYSKSNKALREIEEALFNKSVH